MTHKRTQRVSLDPGQAKSVKFTLDSSDVGSHDNSVRFVVEPGPIDVYISNHNAESENQKPERPDKTAKQAC